MSGKQTLAQQLEATRAELRTAEMALVSSRSHGANAERLANERKAEIADLRDMVHALELERARMAGYLARIGEDEQPDPVVQPFPRTRQYSNTGGGDRISAAFEPINLTRAYQGSDAPLPWYRR